MAQLAQGLTPDRCRAENPCRMWASAFVERISTSVQSAAPVAIALLVSCTHLAGTHGWNPNVLNGDHNRFTSHLASSDCSGPAPSGFRRIFISNRTDTKPGIGTASDPFGGSTARKFDALLRARSESGMTNLVVCIGPGTFRTGGTGDYLLGGGRLDKTALSENLEKRIFYAAF